MSVILYGDKMSKTFLHHFYSLENMDLQNNYAIELVKWFVLFFFYQI